MSLDALLQTRYTYGNFTEMYHRTLYEKILRKRVSGDCVVLNLNVSLRIRPPRKGMREPDTQVTYVNVSYVDFQTQIFIEENKTTFHTRAAFLRQHNLLAIDMGISHSHSCPFVLLRECST